MNYIKHLNGVLDQFSKDTRLNPTHISLYIALFQFWNYNRFPNEFYINREEIMKFSKIGSNTTYHRCIKELSHWKYILYSPSHNPFKGSKVKLFNFSTSNKQDLYLDSTINGQALVSNTNINKQNINFIKLEATAKEKLILDFFKKENYPELEAKKFFNHYQGIGWKVGGKAKMVDWQATARSWMLKAEEMKLTIQKKSNNLPLDHFQDNLHTKQNKNYDEPL
ncbi:MULTISPECIES: hypothetical protein [Flavobacteriaceae]|uniref:Uncharacterized protein n=2 Tax=Flavobacteriaceae TaxID=49546 RepID=A0A4Y8ANN8_9FLAO|nr:MULTISPECIES: hypothetical protein [Flavobacteriaceae]TEW72081.1 hypothetical protein E2488_14530 [Gramella jeungdoensis]GGK56272.1 transcriptional regulator [Lutibacter litoralis]